MKESHTSDPHSVDIPENVLLAHILQEAMGKKGPELVVGRELKVHVRPAALLLTIKGWDLNFSKIIPIRCLGRLRSARD